MTTMSGACNDQLSPTLTSASSFDVITLASRDSDSLGIVTSPDDSATVSSDDEIIWSVSECSLSPSMSEPSTRNSLRPTSSDDDDYVVLGRARSLASAETPTPAAAAPVPLPEDDLSVGISNLSLQGTSPRSAAKKPKAKKATKAVAPAPKAKQLAKVNVSATQPGKAAVPQQPSTATSAPSIPHKRKPKKAKAKKHSGPGTQPVVDDTSSTPEPRSMYDDAVNCMNLFLAHPECRDQVPKLALLQALIVELGLYTPSAAPAAIALPASLRTAKALLKSRAFLNIRDYLAVRDQGLAALQSVMHPSRAALAKDIRKKGNRAPLAWVKEHGLQALLVTCYP